MEPTFEEVIEAIGVLKRFTEAGGSTITTTQIREVYSDGFVFYTGDAIYKMGCIRAGSPLILYAINHLYRHTPIWMRFINALCPNTIAWLL